MIREAVATYAPPRDISLKTPPNWTAAIFFAVLSFLHFSISIPAFYHGRLEGYVSFMLAIVFAVVSSVSYFVRYEMTVLPQQRRIQLRTGMGRIRFSRGIPFSDVHAVRLTLDEGESSKESHLEVLCDNEDIECPPTNVPRQQALLLAITLNVQLIIVSGDEETSDPSDRSF
ncbi:MAG TPA: hypothetical protein VHD56_00015 [Tepidisphaeraceae bacterium]|nr:hypothetical protein [Tepidisphaeraceae bacterium]